MSWTICTMARGEDAATAEWGGVVKRIETAITKKDFATLESIAEDLRLKKARTESGTWRLADFYRAIGGKLKGRKAPDWKASFAVLNQWQRELPGSITQPVVAGTAWGSYAWEARGSGYADTVSEEGWRLMRERLEKGRAVLDEAAKLPDRCIHWYVAMHTIALGQQWSQADYDRLFDEGCAREPTYYDLYFSKAYFLLPRWYGEPGEWERFAEEAQRKTAATEGMALYARIVWAQSWVHTNVFKEAAIDWTKTKQGFEDVVKRWPSPRNLNHFARFAILADDKKTAAELFARIGDKVDMSAWGTPGSLELARRKVGAPGARPAQERATLRAPGEPSRAHAVAFSPDGKLLVAGYANGSLVAWELGKKEPTWTIAAFKKGVSSIAFSPDGTLLAAASGIGEPKSVGSGRLWELPSRKERLAINDFKGAVTTARFSPDGKKLLFVGGPWNTKAETRIIDLATDAGESIPQIDTHKHALYTAAFSPDGRKLVLDCNRVFDVWDFDAKKVVFSSKGPSPGWITSAEFSPDGKTIATGYYTAYMQKGGLGLWDADGYRARKVVVRPDMLGLLTLAFTPDSRLLAGAGYDQIVYVWDVATGQEVASLYGHSAMIYKLAISPDGKTIASASFDGTVKMWDVPSPAAPVN